MDFLFELFGEFFAELYIEIATLIVPEHKFKKWVEVLLKVLCCIVSIAVLVLIIGGILMLTEGKSAMGLLLLIPGALILALHIAMLIVIIKKEVRNKK